MSVKIRNLIPGEPLAGRLKTGYEETKMPEWIWVAERDGKAVAALVAAPAHVVVILIHLVSEDAEPMDVRALLVQVMKDIKERGYRGYITWVDPLAARDKALMHIIEAAGGGYLPINMLPCYGVV